MQDATSKDAGMYLMVWIKHLPRWILLILLYHHIYTYMYIYMYIYVSAEEI